MPDDIAALAERIVKQAEAEHGGTPEVIRISPNGEIEVNVQVWMRGADGPSVYFRQRESGRQAKR